MDTHDKLMQRLVIRKAEIAIVNDILQEVGGFLHDCDIEGATQLIEKAEWLVSGLATPQQGPTAVN